MMIGRRRLLAMAAACAALPACVEQNRSDLPQLTVLPPLADVASETSVVLRTTFTFNSYQLSPAALAEIGALAAAMTTDPRLAYVTHYDINGHTDIVGRLAYNMGLSMMRAGAVADALAARGVRRAALQPQGFGPLQLFDPSNPRSGVNRRVEVVARYD